MNDMLDFNQQVITEFRENAGKVGGMFEGAPMLLLTTIGSKTGQQRTTPLVYLADSDRYIIFASKGGAPEDPSWFNNIVANGDIAIEVGTEKFPVSAEITSGAERDELYARQESIMPGFTEYREKAGRVIPVVALTRK